MNSLRRPLDQLGIGAFGVVSGIIVIAMLWGLFAIDSLLARAASDQREAAADYLQSITQHAVDDRDISVADSRTAVVASVTRSLGAIRNPPSAVAIVLSPADTVFISDDADAVLVRGSEVHRMIQLASGDSAELLVVSESSARDARTQLWVFGTLAILLITIVAIRARQQAVQAAARSADIERLSVEALRANAMKSEFLANVSHELRTPLTAIVGFVEMLRDGVYGELAPRQVGPVDRIAASANHLRQLVDQILDIARIAAGRLEVTREVISLRPFVLNIASELESLFADGSVRMSITVPATLPRVRTDPTHLRHILVNLLGNAVKYTPAGSVSVRARLLAGSHPTVRRTPDDPALLASAPDRDAAWIALQVADTGIGIAERDLERIFDEFEQVNAGPRTDSVARGTGLGLAISRRLSRSLGGDITLDSELGKGSTFTLWLPLELADIHATPVAAIATPPAGQATSGKLTSPG